MLDIFYEGMDLKFTEQINKNYTNANFMLHKYLNAHFN